MPLSRKMGGRVGYEYRYRLWIDDEIMSRCKFTHYVGIKTFLFEFRTNFIVKRRPDDGGGDEILDSERFHACLQERNKNFMLDHLAGHRLKEYWMPADEANRLIHEAFDFAAQIAADPRHASLWVIPVAVGIDVCTVQQDGETLISATDRAIRAQYLVPLYLWSIQLFNELNIRMDSTLVNYLRKLPRIRVEDVDEGLAMMQICRICSRSPTVGAQVTLLPCNHAFHSHCIVRCLERSNLCPVCRSPANDRIYIRDNFDD